MNEVSMDDVCSMSADTYSRIAARQFFRIFPCAKRWTAPAEGQIQAPDRTNTRGLKMTKDNVLPLP